MYAIYYQIGCIDSLCRHGKAIGGGMTLMKRLDICCSNQENDVTSK
jgi:hypothetical protein